MKGSGKCIVPYPERVAISQLEGFCGTEEDWLEIAFSN